MKKLINETNVTIKTEKRKAFLESLGGGASIVKSCKAAGINPVTIWRWRKEEKEFSDEVLAILESRTQTVEDALFKSVLSGNIAAIIFYLKNRDSTRWKDRQEQSVEGGLDITIRYANEKDRGNTKS